MHLWCISLPAGRGAAGCGAELGHSRAGAGVLVQRQPQLLVMQPLHLRLCHRQIRVPTLTMPAFIGYTNLTFF